MLLSREHVVGRDNWTWRDLMGHTSTAMTDDHTHTPADTKQKAVDTLVGLIEWNIVGISDAEQMRLRIVNVPIGYRLPGPKLSGLRDLNCGALGSNCDCSK
jgi:hypothetical protein